MSDRNPAELRSITLHLFLLFFIATPALSQDKATQIDQFMAAYHEYGLFNGSLLVAEGGEVLFKKGYGLAQMEWNIPNESDTKFRLGSITKQFTATLILQLEQEGKLSTEDPINKHLPEYPAEVGSKVTIHHLLTHTSGIPSYTGLPDFFSKMSRDPLMPEEMIEVFAHLPLEFEPGAEWRYNNSAYFLLGAIIEKVSGVSYEDALQERIFGPLEMHNSGYDHHGTILKKRAAGYERSGSGFMTAPYLDMSLPYAAGSLYSTVEDLYIWDRALYTDQVLPAELKSKMFTSYMNSYGYGWGINDARTFGENNEKVTVIGHGGGINGFNTLIERTPTDEHLVVLLNNTGGTSLNEMSTGILNILYGSNPDAPKKPIAMEMREVIEEKGIEEAINRYHMLKADHSDAYNFSEQQLNRLGYSFLGDDDFEGAIAIFKLNTEMFPEASNTYDSLGEAYMEKGDTERAITNYEKALELNPRSNNAKEKLAEMGVEVDAAIGQEIKVAPEILEGYVGKYELQPGFVITITHEESQLFAQATGQPQFEIFAETETEFFLKVVEAQITFHLDSEGKAESITLHQGGQNMPGQRLE